MYDYVREHNEAVNRLDFMPSREPITAEVPAGTVQSVMLHDGGTIRLRKLHAEYDPHDKVGALAYLEAHRAQGEVVTGLGFGSNGTGLWSLPVQRVGQNQRERVR